MAHPCDTEMVSLNLGCIFTFLLLGAGLGHSEQGRARGLSGQETWTAALTLPFLIFPQWLGTLGEEKTYPVSRQGVEEMTGGEGPARGETTGKFWWLLSQNLWNTAPAGEGVSQPRRLENPVHRHQWRGFPGGGSGKEPTCQCRRYKICGFNPWVGSSPGGGHGNPLQYYCLENPMDSGAWRAPVHGVAKSRIQLKWLSTCTSVTRLWGQGYIWARNWEGDRYQSEKCLSLASPCLDLTQ